MSQFFAFEKSTECSPGVSTGTPIFPTRLSSSCNRQVTAASCTDKSIRFFDRNTLALILQLSGHPVPISDIRFAKQSPHILWSCGEDGTVIGWDARSQQAVTTYRHGAPVLCLDGNCNDTALAAGVREEIHVWDLRTNHARVFTESHAEEVSRLRFHPQNPTALLSGGLDGLACYFDLTASTEDDALLQVCNAEGPIGDADFFGAEYENVMLFTEDERLSVWSMVTGARLLGFSNDPRGQLPIQTTETGCVEYFFGCHYDIPSQTLLALAGTHNGELYLARVNPTGLEPLSAVAGGHAATIRCFEWDEPYSFLTGSEDGRISRWVVGH